MSTSRPLLTQREAATACGVSRSTIRRRREAGDLPGSKLDTERGWLVPVEDLLAAGFRLSRVGDWRGGYRSVSSPRHFKPCMQFSRTRLSDIVHRLACAVALCTFPVRR
ncbi:helix-turn-helix domain-containing protein [Streptomyces sp. NPDC058471]|uniref:helix-turn-helix domain-containing protein n=1 Tax=Streptomyces sp. NPDC058471 TaxID=3346516 RepID=UPI00365BFE36